MAPDIKKGDYIYITPNLDEEMQKRGFSSHVREGFVQEFAGTKRRVLDIWADEDSGEYYITVEICCEVPAACCSKIINSHSKS